MRQSELPFGLAALISARAGLRSRKSVRKPIVVLSIACA